jgi:hypothetical protein
VGKARPSVWALARVKVRARVWVWLRVWSREGVIEDMVKGMFEGVSKARPPVWALVSV